MCLETITNVYRQRSKDPNRSGVGYKIFTRRDSTGKSGPRWDGQFRNYNKLLTRKDYGKWLNERHFRSCDTCRLEYSPGWHFYYSRKDAMEAKSEYEVVKKIKFSKLRVRGVQWKAPVGVAKFMMIGVK